MITLTPLQINDVKREKLDDYMRDMAIRMSHYDAIEFLYKLKYTEPNPNLCLCA